ncbi:Oxysterol-binding protein-domain-containing protein [Amylocystis lapponica]|nr:Oxysterol-binding protein-domain-containing protein [Amylocystis lapponica]
MSTSSFTASRTSDLGLPDYLYQVKLLSALRSGDPALIHPFLTDIGKDGRKSSDSSSVDVGAAALHLAIRCASCDTVALLLSHRAISPNAVSPPGSGTTALHLAATLARTDVLNLLLEQDGIDDGLRDSNGKTCLDVAKGKECVRAIQDSRAFLTASYRSLLRTYILSPPNDPPPEALLKLLSSPRIHLVDLSFLDDSSGRTLLHEAARRKDLRTAELAVRAGADVFARDRKGRMVYDGVGKDDRVRVFLRQFTNQDTTLLTAPTSEPPELKGYLNKYTNVAKGYNTRWFVLKNGTLSYSRHQEDEDVASRGAIAMKSAVLTVSPNTSGLRFEVHSTPSRGHHGVQKWYLKANHPVEASRWIQALQKSMEWARREAGGERKSGDSDAPSFKPPSTVGTLASTYFSRKKGAGGAGAGVASTTSSAAEDEPSDASPVARERSGPSLHDGRSAEETSFADSTEQGPPHGAVFALQGNSLVAQVELTAQLLEKLPLVPETPPKVGELKKAVEDTFTVVHRMLDDYVQMVRDREEWWKAKVERERERQNVWEESLQAVVKEGDAMERELRSKFRRRSRMEASFISVQDEGTLKRRPSQLISPPPASAIVVSPEATPAPPTAVPEMPVPRPAASPVSSVIFRQRSAILSPPAMDGEKAESFVDTDEEDEFFDAIESNTLPNLFVNQSLTSPSPGAFISLNKSQYTAYMHLRTRLAITSDNRPPMSLWAVLKNSIGKDLTKISFPVFFNEPTSMLQRMAEDMEFSECLDAACAEANPHRRIAFVAAFAMSNYSSTIGRIAKPFNPMLGETFEYVRFDKDYRYVSEQVSHHPPISACWAESPSWHYYGEVDAQNKFMGKSFEIRPTGIAHADLLLPEDKAPGYPRAKGTNSKGKVVEHYSWKKVTTNVSGFILGSPTIDHYGDMVITNHRTHDQCVLTFKPRGWRGKDAYEVSGYVMDASGAVVYEIAGRWNSQLVARAVGTGVGQLHPDVNVSGPSSPSATPEYILLWRNSVKPPAPFNLTPFAVTLNDCPDTLRPYVCPTDCRLRPDQRAFELGRYEWANELKNKQEELQRKTRRAREEGSLPPHRPRWFSAETEPDTGERVWAPSVADEKLEYWLERDKVWQEKQAGTAASWKEVDPIFIEDEP